MESLLEKHPMAQAPDLEARLALWDQKQVLTPHNAACVRFNWLHILPCHAKLHRVQDNPDQHQLSWLGICAGSSSTGKSSQEGGKGSSESHPSARAESPAQGATTPGVCSSHTLLNPEQMCARRHFVRQASACSQPKHAILRAHSQMEVCLHSYYLWAALSQSCCVCDR